MKLLFFFVLLFFTSFVFGQTFLEKQKTYQRVQIAYKEKFSSIETLLMAAGLELNNLQIFIRIFKQDQLLEIWGKKKNDTTFKLINTYPLCAISGLPGPKRLQGDGQMPEGVYHIIQFNPTSNFYLSLKIDYPNNSDLKFCQQHKCGNDIFIHGNCVTTGCFPIGDEAIKELYILALEATSQGQNRIPVHIFPCKMTDKNTSELLNIYPQHKTFWNSLKTVYDYFETKKTIPFVKVNASGYYEIVR